MSRDSLNEIAELVREHSNEPTSEMLDRIRRDLPETLPARRSPTSALRLAVPVAVAVAAVSLLTFRILGGGETPLSYSVRVSDGAEREGNAVRTHATESQVHFDDGSVLRVLPQTELRVVSTNERGADLELQRGALEVDIVHRDETRWQIVAGEYRVRVTGTRFRVSMEEGGEFHVQMREGSVEVEHSTSGRLFVLEGTDSLSLNVHEEIPPSATDPSPQQLEALAPTEEPSDSLLAEDRALEDEALEDEALADETLADETGRRSVEGRIEPIARPSLAIRISRASDLELEQMLGEARRERSGSEREIIRIARRDRPDSTVGQDSAFLLGRLSFSSDARASRDWFQTYLRERPRGRWVEQAEGRLMELFDEHPALGDARAQAESYLRRYPNGAHASMAEWIVEGS